MTFLYNRWYAAGWVEEVAAKPLGRTILGEEIAFFRTDSGKLTALAAVCPHRFAPLYFGDVVGENIKCKYHGLQFGRDGVCAVNPDGSRPPSTSVKSYPVEESDGMMWVWIGDGQPNLPVPDMLAFAPDMGAFFTGYLHIDCHFQFLTDNLLDHAHATHLHAALTTDSAVKHSKAEVTQSGDTVVSCSTAPNTPASPLFQALTGKNSMVDQWVEMTWQVPAMIAIEGTATDTGHPREEGVRARMVHLITPETETSSHYFWGAKRTSRLNDHAFTQQMRGMFHNIFKDEDKWILEAQQRNLKGRDFWDLKPVMLQQDTATGASRRHMDKLIAEQGTGG